MGAALSVGGETLCENCASRGVVACDAPADRPVPMRVLRSAEKQALTWKRQSEALSRLVNRAIKNGHLPAPYAGEAQRIMAGRA
jgi:anti-sigma factor RsiW